MHHALLLQEVVRAVLSRVDSPATALAFALSSRMYAEVGLEAVWRYGDAWKLAMTIPERYREILKKYNGALHMRLASVSYPAGWAGPRFLLYARFLHTLSVLHSSYALMDSDTVDLSIIRAWTEFGAGHKIFPLLQELSVEWNIKIGSTLVLDLAGPLLQEIRLSFYDSREAAAPEADRMMRGLAAASPHIHYLSVAVDHHSLDLSAPLLAVIPQWTHLRAVQLRGIPATNELLNALSSLADLRTLRFRQCLGESSTTRHRFVSLLDVELGQIDLYTATSFLSALDSPCLRSVELTHNSRTGQGRGRLVDMLRALSKNTHLEEVRMTRYGRAFVAVYTPASENTLALLSCLLSLAHIRRLTLALGQIWGEGDEAVTAIAQAWPELEVLAFTGPNHMSISFHTFALLLSSCPNLHTLGIPIDILSPIPPIGSLRNPPNCLLGSLQFTAPDTLPDVLAVEPVAEFLHAACPLVQCNVSGGFDDRWRVNLDEVARLQTLLDFFRTTRVDVQR